MTESKITDYLVVEWMFLVSEINMSFSPYKRKIISKALNNL